jgi:hypothetical protein
VDQRTLDDYEHAAAAIQRYVGHVLKVNDLNLEHFLCVAEILQFLSNDEGWESRLSKAPDWAPERSFMHATRDGKKQSSKLLLVDIITGAQTLEGHPLKLL